MSRPTFREFLALRWLFGTRDGCLVSVSALAFICAILILLAFTGGCAPRKPATLVVPAGCGPITPPAPDCVATLPPDATDAELSRCVWESRKAWKADAEALRIQFTPCAK